MKKWKVMIMLGMAVSCALTACEGTETADSGAEQEAIVTGADSQNETSTKEVTAEPTEEATAEPTEEATAEPTEEAMAEPTEKATAEPTEEATAKPTEEATAEPTEEATAEPTEEPTTEPTTKPTAEPTKKPEKETSDKDSKKKKLSSKEAKATAKKYIGKKLDSLVDTIGKYDNLSKAESCYYDGEYDGIAEYDGFVVYCHTENKKVWYVDDVE